MENKKLTTASGAPVADNHNVATAGRRGPMLLQDVWFLEKLAHFDREVIPERRMHAKGSGAFGKFTVTHDITPYTKAAIFSEIGKETEVFVRFSTVAGERGAADAERDIRGFAIKFYTEEGNWDLVGNNTPVFFLRDPLKFPDLNHAVKRDPRTNMRSARNNWDFWTLLPEALHQVTITMSDRGIPASYRHMHGYGSHTFSFINAEGKRTWDWPCMYDADEREFDMGEILPKYELGEVVAIAQSYMDVDRFHRKGKNAAYLEYLDSILPELKLHPGWTNKMFVKADLMPRHIEFTDRKVERLQDISDEDCLKEGIYEDSGDDEFPPSIFYEFEGNKDNGFDTPREAFAALIDKVSGKGTWESNPYVWAYEFELMK